MFRRWQVAFAVLVLSLMAISFEGFLSAAARPQDSLSLRGPYPLQDPTTREIYADLFVAEHQFRDPRAAEVAKASSESLLLKHRTTFIVRRIKGVLSLPQDKSGFMNLPREDIVLTAKGQLVRYGFHDPATGEAFALLVAHGRGVVFDSVKAKSWMIPHSDPAQWAWFKLDEKSGAPLKSPKGESPDYDVDWGPKAIVGAQLGEIILARGKELGDQSHKLDVVYDLFVPFKRGFFGFKLEKVTSDRVPQDLALREAKAENTESLKTIFIRVSAANWLIKPFAPEIYFHLQCEARAQSSSETSLPGSKYQDIPCSTMPLVAGYRGPSPIEVKGERYPTVLLDFKSSASTH